MDESLELCCTKMQKAIRKRWIKIYPYPNTNTIEFMVDPIVLIYCPFCGEYLPEINNILTKETDFRRWDKCVTHSPLSES